MLFYCLIVTTYEVYHFVTHLLMQMTYTNIYGKHIHSVTDAPLSVLSFQAK